MITQINSCHCSVELTAGQQQHEENKVLIKSSIKMEYSFTSRRTDNK